MNLYKIFLIISTLLLSSCVVNQNPKLITGSKADGIITVSFEYGLGIDPDNWTEEWAKADKEAQQRCIYWGYSNVYKFDLTYRECIASNLYGCTRWREFVDYQCVNQLDVITFFQIVIRCGCGCTGI